MLIIHENDGFIELPTKSVSSKVFVKDGRIYKINRRNSPTRAISDWTTLQAELSHFSEHIPETVIATCEYAGETYTCVEQPLLEGTELSLHAPEKIREIMAHGRNRIFLEKLLSYFFSSIESKRLYPDLVGNPADPHLFNSVNLMVTDNGLLMLCDVGLSPHEDTVSKHGDSFYDSENVRLYIQRIKDSIKDLN